MLHKLERVTERATWVTSLFGSLAILLMTLHVVADVVARYFFNTALFGTLEVVSAYYMVIISFSPLAFATIHGGQLRVESFTRRLSFRAVHILDAVICLIGAVFLIVMVWQGWLEAATRTASGEIWETAAGTIVVWPSRWVLVVGVALMAMTMLLQVVAHLRAAATGEQSLMIALQSSSDDLH